MSDQADDAQIDEATVLAEDGPAEHGPADDLETDPAYSPDDEELEKIKGG